MLASRLRHRPGCEDPDPRAYVGRLGDIMVRCATCAYYVVVRGIPTDSLRDALPQEPARAPWRGPSLTCVKCERTFPVRPGRATVPLCPRCRR